jgi:hypothetical protein
MFTSLRRDVRINHIEALTQSNLVTITDKKAHHLWKDEGFEEMLELFPRSLVGQLVKKASQVLTLDGRGTEKKVLSIVEEKRNKGWELSEYRYQLVTGGEKNITNRENFNLNQVNTKDMKQK